MKKVIKTILLISCIFAFTVFIPSLLGINNPYGTNVYAEDAGWSQVTLTGDPESAPGGSTTDPFIVLEIVPNKALGEIGYLVGGQEPVDDELFNKDNANGDLTFLGGAITPYNSYTEKPIAKIDSRDDGWIPCTSYTTKGGYFQYVGPNKGGDYQPADGQVYSRVADGTGSFKAVLAEEQTNIYNKSWNPTNYKNVNAYFVYGKPAGVSFYNTSYGYEPCSVTRDPEHKGDYDYNSGTKTFKLNIGAGEYDVLFARSVTNTNLYYMRNDYSIVDDGSGKYSWTLNYAPSSNGNYILETDGKIFQYGNGDHYNYTYKWVDAPTAAASKPTNYYQEMNGTTIDKIWVKNRRVETYYEYNFNVTLVNNEWLKRLTLGIAPEDCAGYQVKVITMTPAELNRPENQSLLSRANIFYINDNYGHNSAYISLYETKNKEVVNYLKLHPEQKFSNLKATCNFGINDLNWSSTMKVFYRVTGVIAAGTAQERLGGYRASVIFDSKYYENAVAGTNNYGPYYRNITMTPSIVGGGNVTVCNVAKLYIMLYQRDPVSFYNLFLSPSAPAAIKISEYKSTQYNYNATKSTGYFVRNKLTTAAPGTQNAIIENTFWNSNTFINYITPDGIPTVDIVNWDKMTAKIAAAVTNYNITTQPTDMIANVIVMNGRDIFTSKFIEPAYDMPQDAIEQAKAYAASQNGGVVPSDINFFGYLQTVANKGMGYDSEHYESTIGSGENGTEGSNLRTYTTVLNIKPTADFADSETNIKTMLAGYNLKIINMTSAQFNSSILDINTHYDAIYFGTGVGRFNGNTSGTLFNKGSDESASVDRLNGSVYNKGDRVRLPSNVADYYTGNDITASKKADLKKFLAAGYPVILENKLYTLSGAVKNNTNLYSFIQEIKGSTVPANVLNYIDYTNPGTKTQFMGKLSGALGIVRPMIRIIEPELPPGAEVNYLYVNPVTDKLNIEFAIVPKGLTANNAIKYNAYLYMDYNEDGIFSESEKLNPVPENSSQSPLGICESKFNAYLYSFDMSKYNGVYQWQVKVVRQTYDADGTSHDTEIRSEITGYAACTHRRTIKVLQITDNPVTDITAYSIEDAVSAVTGPSLIMKYGGFGTTRISDNPVMGKLMDYDLHFTTMTVGEFLQLYDTEPYDATSPVTIAATDKLADYHLLILDNQSDTITNTKGALSNIKAEIASGMGVIFTKDSIRYANQMNYLDSPLFEKNTTTNNAQKTYTALNRLALPTIPDPYYIFDFTPGGLNSVLNQDATYGTQYITSTNEGADAEYPYKIGAAAKIALSSYSTDALIDYSRSDSVPLIGWYTLSDAMSPVVRSEIPGTDTSGSIYTGIYSSSPNDVKNNYYLVNKGNVYYSGIQLKNADVPGNDTEIKLFINTIIASYKNSKRIVSIPPVVNVTDPLDPLPASHVVTLERADVEGLTVIPVTFTLSQSSSNMALGVLWNGLATATGDWNKTIYKVTSSGAISVTDLSNVSNGTYRVDIPVSELGANNTLTINAINKENRLGAYELTLNYQAIPIVVNLENVIKNVDKGEQYLYIDTDYATPDSGNSAPVRLEFSVGGSTHEDVTIFVTGRKEHSSIAGDVDVGGLVHVNGSSVTYTIGNKAVPAGTGNIFYVLIPASVIDDNNYMDITVTASLNSTNSGGSTVTLLRRDQFQLD